MSKIAHIECRSLMPDDLEEIFDLCWNETIDVTTVNRDLSCLENDSLAPEINTHSYIQDYFFGKRYQLSLNLTTGDVVGYSPLQGLDLLYRSGTLSTNEAWVINRMNALINSRRCFVIACLTGLSRVIDCFIEVHAQEWFGPLWALVPDQSNVCDIAGTYMISPEGSAKKVNTSFFIHSGTNQWNRAWLPTTMWDKQWDTHLRNWQGMINNCLKIATKLKVKDMQFLFVPEKDTLARIANPTLFQSGFLPILQIQKLTETAPRNTVLFPLKELIEQQGSVSLIGGDSHLSANDYWTIFQLLLKKFGLKSDALPMPGFQNIPQTGDLGGKFGSNTTDKQIFTEKEIKAEVVGGQSELQIPLRDNYVHFENKKAPIKKSLLILGDSHSSTGANPFLTYIASQFFSHVEFFWNPFCIHALPLNKCALQSYDYILFETSQRFVVPAVRS